MDGIIGVDIGTTGCRACVYDVQWTLISSASTEYPLYMPQTSWAEQNPEEIYNGVIFVIKRALEKSNKYGNNILAMSLSTVFHSLILVDKNCNALYPMLTWADLRSQKYSEYIKEHYDSVEIYKKQDVQCIQCIHFLKFCGLRMNFQRCFQKLISLFQLKNI